MYKGFILSIEQNIALLRRARALIEKGWTKGSWAKDANGEETSWNSRKAKCFCAWGALRRAGRGPSKILIAAQLYDFLSGIIATKLHAKTTGLAPYNDAKHRRKECVLHLFDLGIAELETWR